MQSLIVKDFLPRPAAAGELVDYQQAWHCMRRFTETRKDDTGDEAWLLEHPPVFTLGQAGDSAHILDAGDIPVIKVDRGGQVTYHGPGQIMLYYLGDLSRMGIGVRALVEKLEQAVISVLYTYGIQAYADRKAPGVYVGGKKIAALGLRVKRGCSYHGLCFNFAFDPAPFDSINPCGYAGLQVTQLSEMLQSMPEKTMFSRQMANELAAQLGYNETLTNLGDWQQQVSASEQD